MALDLQTAAWIVDHLGLGSGHVQTRPVSGGDIAQASLVECEHQRLFVKTVVVAHAGSLGAEADGLRALAQLGAVRVPRILGLGQFDNLAWLALEPLELRSRSAQADACLGRQLAELHRHTGAQFGWAEDNFIGLTPQRNTPADDWLDFFRDHRLACQMERLARREPGSVSSSRIARVLRRWELEASNHRPSPSLLHGDLWSGNAAALPEDEPVIFDPAVHYGDRECDLAMTELFGGFSPSFYRAYEAAWPLPAGWEQRRLWYQLYHLLNHANLFGGGYLARLRRELAKLGA